MKSIIVEDKAFIRTALINLLELLDNEVEVVGECESVQEAVIVTNTCTPELIFLDINLTDGTAFDFLDQVTFTDFKVIFITAYEEYALQALKMGAVDYLLKPVDIDELEAAIHKIKDVPLALQKEKVQRTKRIWKKEDDKIILSLHDTFQVIQLEELMYCESDKGYTTFYCSNKRKYVVSKTLKEFEPRLINSGFSRPHQSFMVNLWYIDKYDKSGVIHLKNGKKIPVSSRKKETFLSEFLRSDNT